jgi:hypothetical protein
MLINSSSKRKTTICSVNITGKNDLTRPVTHREAILEPVIHSIFDVWHYEVLWTCDLNRVL